MTRFPFGFVIVHRQVGCVDSSADGKEYKEHSLPRNHVNESVHNLCKRFGPNPRSTDRFGIPRHTNFPLDTMFFNEFRTLFDRKASISIILLRTRLDFLPQPCDVIENFMIDIGSNDKDEIDDQIKRDEDER